MKHISTVNLNYINWTPVPTPLHSDDAERREDCHTYEYRSSRIMGQLLENFPIKSFF